MNHAKIETYGNIDGRKPGTSRCQKTPRRIYHDQTNSISKVSTHGVLGCLFPSTSKSDSHADPVIAATHQEINNNCQCPISPITWHRCEIQNVVTSTLSAETMALSSTLDHLSWLRLHWSSIHDPAVQWNKLEIALAKLALAITVSTKNEGTDLAITHWKSVYELLTQTAPASCSEFKVQWVAREMKKALQEGTKVST